MAQGEVARAPIGYIILCRATPDACAAQIDGPARAHRLTDEGWRQLGDVNAAVNERIQPGRDAALGGANDVWSLDPERGDCEDYALTKRAELMARGWSASALLIAVVRDENGTHHAVLVARTDRGDFVLDNRRRTVLAWSDLPYRWIKIQKAADPRQWVQLGGYVEEMIERKQDFLRRLAARS